jgi:hypothetical protein
MAEQEDEETQVGDFLPSQAEPPPLPPDIYTLRRDSNAIKVRLLALVNDPEYWRVFSTFVYGQCSKEIFDECMERLLRTPEMRILHNELIRAVLYNAHFAMVPPEGVPTPPPPPPTIKPTPPPRTVTFTTYSAADLRHIPSLAELTRRVSALSDAKKMLIDEGATELIHSEVQRYAIRLLQSSLALVGAEEGRGARITATLLQHAVASMRESGLAVPAYAVTKCYYGFPL